MSIKVTWLGHASFKIEGPTVLYIDPWKIGTKKREAGLVLVSHGHYDHFSPEDIEAVLSPDGEIVAPADVIKKLDNGKILKTGEHLAVGSIQVEGIPAYNVDKSFHPKKNGWLGFLLTMGDKRIYYAGDTDATDEIRALRNIDLALLPVGGTYTMTAQEAAEVAAACSPKQAMPYHWGDLVGDEADARFFVQTFSGGILLQPGESLEI